MPDIVLPPPIQPSTIWENSTKSGSSNQNGTINPPSNEKERGIHNSTSTIIITTTGSPKTIEEIEMISPKTNEDIPIHTTNDPTVSTSKITSSTDAIALTPHHHGLQAEKSSPPPRLILNPKDQSPNTDENSGYIQTPPLSSPTTFGIILAPLISVALALLLVGMLVKMSRSRRKMATFRVAVVEDDTLSVMSVETNFFSSFSRISTSSCSEFNLVV
jgi:hypothetical protein